MSEKRPWLAPTGKNWLREGSAALSANNTYLKLIIMLVNQSVVVDIKAIIARSKDKAIRAVDHERTLMYWDIGKRIFEEEQQGKDRADYGKYLTEYIAKELQNILPKS